MATEWGYTPFNSINYCARAGQSRTEPKPLPRTEVIQREMSSLEKKMRRLQAELEEIALLEAEYGPRR